MKEQDSALAEKVLDYWFTMEFLAQDPFPDHPELTNRVKKRKQNPPGGREKSTPIIEDFLLLRGSSCRETLYEVIAKEARACGMKKWGNLTIYIGKVRREKCIDRIAEVLPFTAEDGGRPEKNTDQIAWTSLQLSPSGEYIRYSLSLSAILWALRQVKSAKGDLSASLDAALYAEAVEELETMFFGPEAAQSEGQEEEDDDTLQSFSAGAVTFDRLRGLYQEIEKRYLKGNIQNSETEKDAYEEVYAVQFQMFADGRIKSKKEEDQYLGLTHDYFSNDIRLVQEQIRSGALEDNCHMGKDLLAYVTVLKERETEGIDLVDPGKQGKAEYQKQIQEILSVENAPLGKWPSRFMPAFMQQTAINLAIGKGCSELYAENGNIFSVNGPPGTGKTTLLKEIVVSNIIERAILLSEYKNPEDAFEEHDFLRGEEPGNAYSKYTRHWYSLKNDEINRYSMLVTSCNNAAVENISKELPKKMTGDLSPLDGDPEELRGALAEVGRLFEPEESDVIETTCQGGKGSEKIQYRDIYFTKYAQELLDDTEVWGLVAAPLGRRSNLNQFYQKVLYPLGWDFYGKKETAPNRLPSYQKARKQFLRQLEIVREMQSALGKAGALSKRKAEAKASVARIEMESGRAIAEAEQNIKKGRAVLSEFEKAKEQICANMLACKKAAEQAKTMRQSKKEELSGVREKRKRALEKELEKRNSVSGIQKLFQKSKYKAAMKLAEEYGREAGELEAVISDLESELELLNQNAEEALTLSRQAEREYQSHRSETARYAQWISSEEEKAADHRKKIFQAQREAETARKEYESEISQYTGAGRMDERVAIDESFVEKLLSKDIRTSTDAQVANPWFTQRYNREREKLFGYAMRMNKEFVVSSNHCRDNFVTLSHYWGLRMGDENERILFHQEDKELMVPALFQTLFLLVPVLSSTFASVGRLLRDITQPGVIGTLVVDEVGQAQPQMALGALYRSRRAVIVGDPKQVEPVVTDDLILLRKAYQDPALKPYKKKTLSVQAFADGLNRFGTYLDNGTEYPEWVGCPLLVHRRCISPMYDISNEISYNGIMKQQTRPPKPEKAARFIYEKSQWINVKGEEKGNKNHFVEAQARKVCELLEIAFSKNPEPGIYIISPFTTVVAGIRKYIDQYCKENTGRTRINSRYILDHDQKKIGTVHTFQGKEADEVIFLLGCDPGEGAKGAVRWVNRNIVNVAATRAKFRLYVIGDEDAWKESACISAAKNIIDTFAIKEIKSILEQDLPEEERREALLKASAGLPSVTAFSTAEVEYEGDAVDYSIDTSGLIQGLNEEFLTTELTSSQLGKFGFDSGKALDQLSGRVRDNLLLGMKLYFLLEPVYRVNPGFDGSCCAILFCKAMELRMKDCFLKSLQELFPEFKIRGMGKGRSTVALKDAKYEELTLGAFGVILRNHRAELGRRMKAAGNPQYDENWWRAFEARLQDCANRRNQCCHSGLFSWMDHLRLLADLFRVDKTKGRDPKIGGILFESAVGMGLSGSEQV